MGLLALIKVDIISIIVLANRGRFYLVIVEMHPHDLYTFNFNIMGIVSDDHCSSWYTCIMNCCHNMYVCMYVKGTHSSSLPPSPPPPPPPPPSSCSWTMFFTAIALPTSSCSKWRRKGYFPLVSCVSNA